MAPSTSSQSKVRRRSTAVTSSEGRLWELLYRPTERKTSFVTLDGDAVVEQDIVEVSAERRILPISPENNLLRHDAVLLPSAVVAHGGTAQLVRDIRAYVARYVDLSDSFLYLASWYILLTWVYDAFNEIPYLRFRGDYGSGKTRALTVIGSITYKGFFASGASTVSPIFHTLDTFRGTLIFDEADFRFSDEKAELVKILNNGNVRGFPVLRTAMNVKHEFDPQAFVVFGPKIVAMRGSYDDQALESRFLTEEMGQRPVRTDIPINLPDLQKVEAQQLRNRLLDYRLRNWNRVKVDPDLVDSARSARMNQILVPLLSIVEGNDERERLLEAVATFDDRLAADRTGTTEAGVLGVLGELLAKAPHASVPVSTVTDLFARHHGHEFERPVTSKFVGGIIRRRLRLLTIKRHGVYVVPESEAPKVRELSIRYGVVSRTETLNSSG